MKHLIRFSVALGLIMVLSGVAHATGFDQIGRVDVITALSISQTSILDFGTVSANDGFLTLDTSDTITADANGISVPGGSIASGDYTISGESGSTVQVVLSAGSMPAGLALTNFTTFPADLSAATLTGGNLQFNIGADLTMTAASVATGTNQALNFTIAVTYQ